jgi:predicted choloylglycine hydrolase
MWVFLGGPPGKECVTFQYERTRSHETAYEFLKGYDGLFQSDDYEGYHTAIRRLKNETKQDSAFSVLGPCQKIFPSVLGINEEAGC